MKVILHIITSVLSFSITFPFIVTLLVYAYFRIRGEDQLRSFHRSADYSTVFFIMSIYYLEAIYSPLPILAIITIILLIFISIVIIYQRKKRNEVDVKKAFKITWRFCFLIFLLLYFIFSLYGIIHILLH